MHSTQQVQRKRLRAYVTPQAWNQPSDSLVSLTSEGLPTLLYLRIPLSEKFANLRRSKAACDLRLGCSAYTDSNTPQEINVQVIDTGTSRDHRDTLPDSSDQKV